MVADNDRILTSLPDFAEVIERYVTSRLNNMSVMFPCIVQKYYTSEQAVDVLLTLKELDVTTGDNNNSDDIIISKIPVEVYASSSTCGVVLPIKKGTLGSVIVSDLDLSKWVYSDGTKPQPIESRLTHFLNSCVFRAGMRPYSEAVSNYDADNATFFNGDMKVVLHPDGKIEIKNASNKEVIDIISTYMGKLTAVMNGVINDTLTVVGTADLVTGAVTGTAIHVAPLVTWTADKLVLDTAKTDIDTMKV